MSVCACTLTLVILHANCVFYAPNYCFFSVTSLAKPNFPHIISQERHIVRKNILYIKRGLLSSLLNFLKYFSF